VSCVVSLNQINNSNICPRCDGYDEDFDCEYFENFGGFYKDGREIPRQCQYCKYNNSYGKYGCPVCWDIHGKDEEDDENEWRN